MKSVVHDGQFSRTESAMRLDKPHRLAKPYGSNFARLPCANRTSSTPNKRSVQSTGRTTVMLQFPDGQGDGLAMLIDGERLAISN
jgi:hypothetical protein